MPDYNYDESFLRDRVNSGPDKNRERTMDQWFAAAQQGDQNALQQLANMAGVSGTGQGWATADARNYDKMLLAKLSGGQYTPQYDQAHDGGSLMHTLGGVLKVAAPLAGMAIPGVGALGAMAIGAGGSALGGAASGDKFNLLKTLGAGAAAAGGNKLFGNGFGSGSTNWGFGSTPSGGGGGMPGTGTQSMPGAAPGASGGQSTLGKLGSFFGDNAGKILGGGAALGGFLDARNQQKSAADFNNQMLDLKREQLDMAKQDYASRAPLRNTAIQRLGAMASGPLGSSIYGKAA